MANHPEDPHRDYPAHPPDPDHPMTEEEKDKEAKEREEELPQGVGPQPEQDHIVIPPEDREDAEEDKK